MLETKRRTRIPRHLEVFFITRGEIIGKITGGLPVLIIIVASIPIIRWLVLHQASQFELIGAGVLGVVCAFLLMMAMNFAVNRLGPRRWRR